MKCATCQEISKFRLAAECRSYEAFDETVEGLNKLCSAGVVVRRNPEKVPRYFDCTECGGTWEVWLPDPPLPSGLAYESPRSKRIEKLKSRYASPNT